MDEKTMRKIEDRVTETKSRSFCPPTNEAVVKAWEAFDKRVVAVYDPDTDVKSEPGSRHFFGIGEAGDIIRGIELRKDRQTMEHDLDAWMKVSDFMGDVFPQFVNPDEDRALLLVDEWNDLMDAIAHDDEEASPDVRQAAEDQKIVALGHQYQYEGVCCQAWRSTTILYVWMSSSVLGSLTVQPLSSFTTPLRLRSTYQSILDGMVLTRL